jgi:hypothetical protein
MEPTCSAFYYRYVCVCKTCGFHNLMICGTKVKIVSGYKIFTDWEYPSYSPVKSKKSEVNGN